MPDREVCAERIETCLARQPGDDRAMVNIIYYRPAGFFGRIGDALDLAVNVIRSFIGA